LALETLAIVFSLSFFLFLQADQEKEEDQLGSPLCDQRDLGEIFSPCLIRLASMEERKPEASCQDLSLSL
jgi:hypothetical protein